VSVPFAEGKLLPGVADSLVVFGPKGAPVPTQTRVVWKWLDGSVRWLFVTFDATAGPGQYMLRQNDRPALKPILSENGDELILSTGAATLRLRRDRPGWFQSIAAPDADGKVIEIMGGDDRADMVITRADGRRYRSRLARSPRVVVEENGPVRASVRCEGSCLNEEGQKLFDYIVRWEAFRGRSQFVMTTTWVNRTDSLGERVRDLRISFPYSFEPTRIVTGCERGVYDAPFVKGNSYFVLQEDHDQYWAKRTHTDGRVLNLATGGANGKRCPGWLYVENDSHSVGVHVPQFWQECPNELTAEAGKLTVGLWPERANEYLSSKVILPPHADPKTRYRHTKYWPILPHPYLAFYSKEDRCLDVPQGVAKTQRIVLDVWAGAGATHTFEHKCWKRSLLPVRGQLDPAYVADTGVFGRITAHDAKRFPKAERMLAEAFGWLDRHVDVCECYGKFDYGGFRYMTPSTTYLTCTGKWKAKQEMPREGYWHNNERDTLRGVLLHYFRTGDTRAFDLAAIAAQHAFDVDIRHHPHYGMYTHSYGHCYRALGIGGASDHAWLLGMLEWACVSGDPVMRDWVLRCGQRLVSYAPKRFARTDLRSTSMQLHMMSTFYRYTGDEKYLKNARAVAEALRDQQMPNGLWMAYLSQPKRKHYMAMAFANHTLLALADYLEASGDERLLPVLTRAVDGYCDLGKDQWYPAEVGLIAPALDLLWRKTRDPKYVAWARRLYDLLCREQCLATDPMMRGEFWPDWIVNQLAGKPRPGRPPQFANQARPLAPSTVLAYGTAALSMLAETGSAR